MAVDHDGGRREHAISAGRIAVMVHIPFEHHHISAARSEFVRAPARIRATGAVIGQEQFDQVCHPTRVAHTPGTPAPFKGRILAELWAVAHDAQAAIAAWR